jgi:uncharacterized membrane protein YfcA
MTEIIEQYKKTFAPMQAAIAIATVVIFFMSHHLWLASATFFLFMQAGAFLGAAWGTRLRKKVLRGL